MDILLGIALPHLAASTACLARNAAAHVRGKDGTELPFLPWRENLGTVESRLRGQGHGRRRSGDLQSGTDVFWGQRHCVAGGIPLRRHPRLRRSSVSIARLL